MDITLMTGDGKILVGQYKQTGRAVGYCPRCHNKVLQPKYAKEENGVLIHVATVQARWSNGLRTPEICGGEIIPCEWEVAQHRQDQDLKKGAFKGTIDRSDETMPHTDGVSDKIFTVEENAITSFKGPYSFLSNFSSSRIYDERMPLDLCDRYFPTLEHWYQANKCLYKRDFIRVLYAGGPVEAKRIGRGVVLRENWDEEKLDVMAQGLALKFAEQSDLAQKLVNTSPLHLVEGNYWGDTYWGAVELEDGGGWMGENHLGKLLMERREELMT